MLIKYFRPMSFLSFAMYLAFFFCLIYGLLSTVNDIPLLISGIKSRKWPTVEGIIIESTIASYSPTIQSQATDEFGKVCDFSVSLSAMDLPLIIYSYNINLKKYTSQRVSWSKPPTGAKEIDATLKKYPMRKTIKVFYDPNNPQISTLESGIRNFNQIIYHNFFVIASISGMIITTKLIKRKAK